MKLSYNIVNNMYNSCIISRKLVEINLAAVDIFGVAIRAKHATPHGVTADVHGARCGHAVARQTSQCIELVAVFAPVWALNLNSIMTSHLTSIIMHGYSLTCT